MIITALSAVNLLFKNNQIRPVGKIVEKTVCFLTIWHCILSAKLTKTLLLQTVFLAILPTGRIDYGNVLILNLSNPSL